ncbi:MAG: sigma-70 family RNA polymerase sigma factor [Betaproteobacteria bacterium]|nr:sigma-70 family RNA polymerase sigma factor [Betaproteobacteria bacterium]MDH3439012.1 sigma-70 family RNA polymerase sigma factor [Betaproteobacteria bacterium]
MSEPLRDAQASRLAELLSQSALRNQSAFSELYSLTAPKLFGVALRILRRQDWAEEVLQECYMNIWNHAADYAVAKSAPLTWMTSIVRNRCLDWLRRPQQEATGDEYEIAVEAWQDENPGPVEQLMAAGDAAALGHCLEGLEARQRQSIMLAFFHGMSHSEVAGHMKQPLGTVKTWVRRGLERLKGCLEKGENP